MMKDPLSQDRSSQDFALSEDLGEEERVQLNTEIPESLKAKVDAVAFFENMTRVEIVSSALGRYIKALEEERGEAYQTK